ncbi:MAG: YicC family protein [Cyclobacteriaceae bacterium]|nr:YicC family protein [Cyclobacteriaceae bacterium]
MIKSMTGYGIASLENNVLSISVEVKSLNSKFLDTVIKLPRSFFDKEIEVKKLISEKLDRGKISVNVSYDRKDDQVAKIAFNKKLLKTYYQEVAGIASELGAPTEEILKIVLQYPEVIKTDEPKDKLQDDWKKINDTLLEAITKCEEFRISEGSTLKKKLVVYVDRIENYLNKVDKKDPARTEAIKERLQRHINELQQGDKFDTNRFEQEMLYYMEKLDISEEKVRLKSHLDYFLEILNQDTSQGKKLSFLSQEMGREINTIGSKANDAEVQKLVVSMKDELEKIKEQLQNIL